MADPIPVICDRCRASGTSGDEVFAQFGALLDFDPVPRRTNRPDGWDEEVQRTYVAALSLTGSVRAACRAVGKAVFGVTQLLAAPGSEGFAAACDEAMALAKTERSRRLAERLRAVASEEPAWRPPEAPWAQARGPGRPVAALPGRGPVPQTEAEREQAKEALLKRLLQKHWYVLKAERRERLAGNVVAADHYARQLTMHEVMFDLACDDGSGTSAFWLMQELSRKYDFSTTAETPMSKLLGAMRRRHWEECGEPPRPAYPPPDRLWHRDGYSIAPPEFTQGGLEKSHEEQQRAFDEQHARDALAIVEWEAQAIREAAAWRERLEAEEAAAQNPSPLAG